MGTSLRLRVRLGKLSHPLLSVAAIRSRSVEATTGQLYQRPVCPALRISAYQAVEKTNEQRGGEGTVPGKQDQSEHFRQE